VVDEWNLKESAAGDHRLSKDPVLLGWREFAAGMIVGEKKSNGVFVTGKPHCRPHNVARMSQAGIRSSSKQQMACDQRLVGCKYKYPQLFLLVAHESSRPVGGFG
jgi:hypothetical protein